MNKEQFKKIIGENKIITVNDLADKSDRTLLYGYTCERETWHVYLYKEEIFTVIYKYEESPMQINVHHNLCYVPDKRLYPERCDYEFCNLLKGKGIDLPFTTWTEEIEERIYYGELLKEHY